MKTLSLLALALVMGGCAIRKPVQAMFCDQRTPDGKHCMVWAKHPTTCVHDVYGDCTIQSK